VDGVSLELLDRTVALPGEYGDAIKVALDGATFTPADLPALDDSERLELARRLLREGLLVED
jgi:hypothetical protein